MGSYLVEAQSFDDQNLFTHFFKNTIQCYLLTCHLTRYSIQKTTIPELYLT